MFANRIKFVLFAAAGLVLAMAFAPLSAYATTATATIAVSTTVTNTCTISATGLPFPAYTGAAADPGTATLTINCTNLANYSVALDKGLGAGASVTTRQMTNGSSTLGYSLYKDSGHGTIWGDGTGSTVTVAGTGNGTPQTLTVYGQIPSGENSISGTYTDTVTATITY